MLQVGYRFVFLSMTSVLVSIRARVPAIMLATALALGCAMPICAQGATVETEMRHVDFHVDATLVLQINYLRGRLVPASAAQPPTFDTPRTFAIEMDTASITLRTTALADLLNRYVFNYSGSPLRKLVVTTDSGRLKQKGHLHGLPFSVLSTVSITADGELRLHPQWMHAFGISIKGLMHVFGLSLQKVANVQKAPGVRIEKDDLLLTPAVMLPPPYTRGHLVAAVIRDSSITLMFGRHGIIHPLVIPDLHAKNYMYFKGSTIRFGRLTMTPADLLVVDHDPRNPFDFWLEKYQAQLVAGVSHTTRAGGLITEWPDFFSLKGAQ